MVSTRRTRSRVESSLATEVSPSVEENAFSPRKTRSGRSRTSHRSLSDSVFVNSDKGENVKPGTTKRRGRPPKQCPQKSLIKAESKQDESENVINHISPTRQPLVELENIDQQLVLNVARSPTRSGDGVCTPNKRIEGKKLSVYSSPISCTPELREHITPVEESVIEVGLTDDVRSPSDIIHINGIPSPPRSTKSAISTDVNKRSDSSNSVNEASPLSSISHASESCHTNEEDHLGGSKDYQSMESSVAPIEGTAELVTLPEESDMQEFSQSTEGSINKRAQDSTSNPRTPIKPDQQQSDLGIPYERDSLRSPISHQGLPLPRSSQLSKSHSPIIESPQNMQEPHEDAEKSRSCPTSPVYSPPTQIEEAIVEEFTTERTETPQRLPVTPTTTWIDGIEYSLPPDSWSPSPPNCAQHQSPIILDCISNIKSLKSIDLPMAEAESLIVIHEQNREQEEELNQPDVMFAEEPVPEVTRELNRPSHKLHQALHLLVDLEDTSSVELANVKTSTIEDQQVPKIESIESRPTTISDVDAVHPDKSIDVPVVFSKISLISDQENIASECNLVEDDGAVPELADDSLVEAFEHELGIPETTFMTHAEPNSMSEYETPGLLLTVSPESAGLPTQCLNHVDEVEKLEPFFSVTESERSCQSFNVSKASMRESIRSDSLPQTGEQSSECSVSGESPDCFRNDASQALSSTCPELKFSVQNDRLSQFSLDNCEELSFIQLPTTILNGATEINVASPLSLQDTNTAQLREVDHVMGTAQELSSRISVFRIHDESQSRSDTNGDSDSGGGSRLLEMDNSQLMISDLTVELEHEKHDRGSPIVKKQRKSAARRQSRRQSYMTATKSAVRERELEWQRRQEDQEQIDLQLSAELEPIESLLEEMPGSVERKRSKRRSNSTSRRSPLYEQLDKGSINQNQISAEVESSSPKARNLQELEGLHERSAITIQTCFRGWTVRRQLKDTVANSDSIDSPANATVVLQSQKADLDASTDLQIEEEDCKRSIGKDSSIDNVFSNFLKQWQSKKSQKAKLDDVASNAEIAFPGTPKRTQAGTLSPQKSDKKTVSVMNALPSSAQKMSKTSSQRASRSRLPAPRLTVSTAPVPDTNKKAGSRQIEARRGNSNANILEHDAVVHEVAPGVSISEIDRKRKEADTGMSEGARKRVRITKSAIPGPSGNSSSTLATSRNKPSATTQPVAVIAPTTPKRLLYLTPAEVAKTTRNFTSLNRLYRCDFDRVVVRKEIQRPPSPTAKLQAKLATSARTKRRRLMKEKGYTFGAGDEEDYIPKTITPERKAVKFAEALEINLTSLPKTTPSRVRKIEEVSSCIAPVSLDDYGNTSENAPLTPELGKAPTVLITKYLYRGEQDDS